MTQIHVLVATADRALAITLIDYLDRAGISCDYGHNARTSLALLDELNYDVIILDAALPNPGKIHLCQHLRSAGEQRPILVLSRHDDLPERIAHFTAGADDCQPTWCPLEELRMRLIALSQRSSGKSRRLALGALELDLDSLQATCSARPLKLSPTTRILLETLLRAAPGCVPRERLERAVWGDSPPDGNTLNVHLHYLRKAIDSACGRCLLETVRGSGVRLIDTPPDG